MKIMTTLVTFDGSWDPANNGERIDAGKSLIQHAVARNARMLALPAGYLVVLSHSPHEVLSAAKVLLEKAREARLALLLGVDSLGGGPSSAKSSAHGESPTGRRLWIVGWDSTGTLGPFEQRAIRPNDPLLDGDARRRTMRVGSRSVTVLGCGEAFQRDLRASAETGRNAVVNPCHTAGGARYSNAIKWAEQKGLTLLRSVHAANPWSVQSGVGEEPLEEFPGPPFILAQLRHC